MVSLDNIAESMFMGLPRFETDFGTDACRPIWGGGVTNYQSTYYDMARRTSHLIPLFFRVLILTKCQNLRHGIPWR